MADLNRPINSELLCQSSIDLQFNVSGAFKEFGDGAEVCLFRFVDQPVVEKTFFPQIVYRVRVHSENLARFLCAQQPDFGFAHIASPALWSGLYITRLHGLVKITLPEVFLYMVGKCAAFRAGEGARSVNKDFRAGKGARSVNKDFRAEKGARSVNKDFRSDENDF